MDIHIVSLHVPWLEKVFNSWHCKDFINHLQQVWSSLFYNKEAMKIVLIFGIWAVYAFSAVRFYIIKTRFNILQHLTDSNVVICQMCCTWAQIFYTRFSLLCGILPVWLGVPTLNQPLHFRMFIKTWAGKLSGFPVKQRLECLVIDRLHNCQWPLSELMVLELV